MKVERVVTGDGSTTLRAVGRDVTFRSLHGARTESRHVFVEPCFARFRGRGRPTLRILELGFGGATNFGEAYEAAQRDAVRLEYVAVECDAVSPADLVCDGDAASLAARALEAGCGVASDERATLRIVGADWTVSAKLLASEPPFDAVFHDPFGPDVDPTCWTEECFRWSRQLVGKEAALATYSSAGHVRRALEAAGWVVEKRPGPPGKREVVLAIPRTS